MDLAIWENVLLTILAEDSHVRALLVQVVLHVAAQDANTAAHGAWVELVRALTEMVDHLQVLSFEGALFLLALESQLM